MVPRRSTGLQRKSDPLRREVRRRTAIHYIHAVTDFRGDERRFSAVRYRTRPGVRSGEEGRATAKEKKKRRRRVSPNCGSSGAIKKRDTCTSDAEELRKKDYTIRGVYRQSRRKKKGRSRSHPGRRRRKQAQNQADNMDVWPLGRFNKGSAELDLNPNRPMNTAELGRT